MNYNIFLLILLPYLGIAQGNCLLYPKDSPCRKACELCEQASHFYQGSRQALELRDQAIAICPEFAYAWSENSVAYLKRGDYHKWRSLIDSAVKYDPISWLGYRGACSYEFIHDYDGALTDFIQLESIKKGHLGYNANGDYPIRTLMGLCYRDKGDLAEALKQITHSIDENFKNGAVGTYDYLHRAVTYMKLNQWNLALEDLQLQFNNYPQFPDTYYYLSLVYIQNNDRAQALTQLQKAKSLYTKNHRADPYVIMPDQIFESDIDEKIEEVQSLLTR